MNFEEKFEENDRYGSLHMFNYDTKHTTFIWLSVNPFLQLILLKVLQMASASSL